MIRILRLLEYTFDTAEDAERHMSQLINVPANGTFSRYPNVTIRSAIITDFASLPLDSSPSSPGHDRSNPYPQ